MKYLGFIIEVNKSIWIDLKKVNKKELKVL